MMAAVPSRGFTMTRHFAVPPAVVFRAWTDPGQLHWFAGTAAGEADSRVDLRVGGFWSVRLVEGGPEGRTYRTGGLYEQIVPSARLLFRWGAVDGWPELDPKRPESTPLISLVFTPADRGTDLELTLSFADQLTDVDVRRWLDLGVQAGWTSTLDRLPAHLSTNEGV